MLSGAQRWSFRIAPPSLALRASIAQRHQNRPSRIALIILVGQLWPEPACAASSTAPGVRGERLSYGAGLAFARTP